MDVDPPGFEDGPSGAHEPFAEAHEPTPEPLVVDIPLPTPPPIVTTRTGRQLKVPKALQDFVPSSTNGLSTHIPRPARISKAVAARSPTPSHDCSPSPQLQSLECVEYETEPNEFGVFRVYSSLPSRDPEEDLTLSDLADSLNFGESDRPSTSRNTALGTDNNPDNPILGADNSNNTQGTNIYAPFENSTVFRLMKWHHASSSIKSAHELDRLVHDVLVQPDFNANHLQNFRFAREAQRLDEATNASDNPFGAQTQWKRSSVRIPLPREGTGFAAEEAAPTFEVEGILHRSLIEMIKAANLDPVASKYHYDPHKLFCRHPAQPSSPPASSQPSTPSTSPHVNEPPIEFEETRIHGEAYNSDSAIEEEEMLLGKDRNPEDPPDLPYKVTPIYISSDSTKVARFGAHYLWPIFIFFANFSKYFRARPSCFAAHHLAYIPNVCSSTRLILIFAHSMFPSSRSLSKTST